MTGHYQFEKRGSSDQADDEHRNEIIKQLEELGVPPRELAALPDGALRELLQALKKVKSMTRKDS